MGVSESVVVYARSNPEDGSDGPARIHEQQAACSAAATRLGAEVVASFVDVGFDGHTLDRPGLKHLMGWLDFPGQAQPDFVAVSRPDRLSEREPQLMRIYAELGRRGIRLLIAETDAVIEVVLPKGMTEEDRRPHHERLADHEIDLTGSVEQTDSLVDVIGDAIVEAGPDGEVPEWGARAIARLLANTHDTEPSALHHFAATGQVLDLRIVEELSTHLDRPTLTRFEHEIIGRLGTYLLAMARRERQVAETRYSEATRALIAERGPAYAAFLQLRDISEENAPDLFFEAHAGSFDDLDDVIDRVIDDLGLEEHLLDAPVDCLSIDRIKVLRLARERWDIVPYSGHYYIFEK